MTSIEDNIWSCDNSSWNDGENPLKLDYMHIILCDLSGFQFITVPLLFFWIGFLAHLMGNTASNYFSPTLGSICSNLYIPYDIAGVTFLAFGNGAPDIFSSLASFGDGADVMFGIGSLLGGSMFIVTVVVGMISIFNPCEVEPFPFVRDVLFHIVSISTISYLSIVGQVNVSYALWLFIIYFLYVVFVLMSSWIVHKYNIIMDKDDGLGNDIPMKDMNMITQLQTAFWHNNHISNDEKTKQFSNKTFNSIKSNISDSNTSGDYKFLILDDNDEDDNGEENKLNNGDNSDDEGATINLSLSTSFGAAIIDDYCDSPTNPSTQTSDLDSNDKDRNNNRNNSKSNVHIENGGGLTDSLLPSNSISYSNTSNNKSTINNKKTRYESAVAALYWNQFYLRRRLQRNLITSEFWDYSLFFKFLSVIEFPFKVLRDLTIPTVDDEMWNKTIAIMQPHSAMLFFLFVSGNINNYSIWFTFIIGFLPAIMIFIFTHNNHPPTSKIFKACWILLAFMMCISWIDVLSQELISCLIAVGNIFNISPAYLGLTLLAWGNSVGDFFANIAIAKQGYGKMAIAGCYGGPVFNILIGLSLSFGYVCVKTYPKSFITTLDYSSTVSIVFLYISLISTLVIVSYSGFRFETFLGFYLVMLYAAYTICQFTLLLFF